MFLKFSDKMPSRQKGNAKAVKGKIDYWRPFHTLFKPSLRLLSVQLRETMHPILTLTIIFCFIAAVYGQRTVIDCNLWAGAYCGGWALHQIICCGPNGNTYLFCRLSTHTLARATCPPPLTCQMSVSGCLITDRCGRDGV